MNALLYAVNMINQSIPYELRHAGVMMDEQEATANITTIDDKILRKVIRKRVLLDANVVGGVEMIIALNTVQPSFYEQFYTVYQIPPELLLHREIISVLGLSFIPTSGVYGPATGMFGSSGSYNSASFGSSGSANAVTGVSGRIGDAASSSGMMNNTHTEIVGHNTILVYAHYRMLASLGLRVVVENENNMNNIQPRSYINFGKLCTLAVKAYLYNKLIIPINSGYLSSGQDLGMFKSILESYSSAEEDYQVFLREVWTSVAYMNDTTRYNRLLSSMLSPGL